MNTTLIAFYQLKKHAFSAGGVSLPAVSASQPLTPSLVASELTPHPTPLDALNEKLMALSNQQREGTDEKVRRPLQCTHLNTLKTFVDS